MEQGGHTHRGKTSLPSLVLHTCPCQTLTPHLFLGSQHIMKHMMQSCCNRTPTAPSAYLLSTAPPPNPPCPLSSSKTPPFQESSGFCSVTSLRAAWGRKQRAHRGQAVGTAHSRGDADGEGETRPWDPARLATVASTEQRLNVANMPNQGQKQRPASSLSSTAAVGRVRHGSHSQETRKSTSEHHGCTQTLTHQVMQCHQHLKVDCF